MSLDQIYLYGAMPHVPGAIRRVSDGAMYKVISDRLGSVRMVVRAEGTTRCDVVQSLSYDAFGQVVAEGGTRWQPFGFAGGLMDWESGLVRFGARDYDPGLGRWVSKDPIRFDGGENLYGYVSADPVNFIDPTGLFIQGAIPVGAAVAGGAVVGGALILGGGYLCFVYGPCKDWIKDPADATSGPPGTGETPTETPPECPTVIDEGHEDEEPQRRPCPNIPLEECCLLDDEISNPFVEDGWICTYYCDGVDFYRTFNQHRWMNSEDGCLPGWSRDDIVRRSTLH